MAVTAVVGKASRASEDRKIRSPTTERHNMNVRE